MEHNSSRAVSSFRPFAGLSLEREAGIRIGIIGAGSSGSILAAHILRKATSDIDVTLIAGGDSVGQGVAYSTLNPDHLLNVRAANMSAFEDDPSHFLRWLWARDNKYTNASSVPPSGQAFVPRQIYGAYIKDVLDAAIVSSLSGTVTIVEQTAVDIRVGTKPTVVLNDGRLLYFDKVVLCLGNFTPSPPAGLSAEVCGSARYIGNPWPPGALNRISPEDEVLILGAGLTMADVLQTLYARRHAGKIQVISRHGFLPQRHEAVRPYKNFLEAYEPTTVLSLFRHVRAELRSVSPREFGWRSVLDAFRPSLSCLWQKLSIEEKQRFLRHVRPYWEIHRHRLAPKVADLILELMESGQLRLSAGRIKRAFLTKSGSFELEVFSRGQARAIAASWIINCSGPQQNYEKIDDPLVSTLLRNGIIRADQLRLGLDVMQNNALISRDGRVSPWLYALGPPTKGLFWEATAIPDIRRFSSKLADTLMSKP